jgi:hypothetical protein
LIFFPDAYSDGGTLYRGPEAVTRDSAEKSSGKPKEPRAGDTGLQRFARSPFSPAVKRFTETEKWRDPWFRRLTLEQKVAFEFVRDNCDNAGVWDPDFDLADFSIGQKLPWPTIIAAFGDRLQVLPNGKWFLTRFIEFQYGELVEECRPHAKVLQLLKGHSIPYRKGIKRVSIPNRIGQDNTGSGSEGENGAESGGVAPITAEQIYDAYPRKEARQDALRAIGKAMDRYPSDKLLAATKAYATAAARWSQEDRRFIPYPATWYNGSRYEDDPATWNRGAPPVAARPDIYTEPAGWREKARAKYGPNAEIPEKWNDLSSTIRNDLIAT